MRSSYSQSSAAQNKVRKRVEKTGKSMQLAGNFQITVVLTTQKSFHIQACWVQQMHKKSHAQILDFLYDQRFRPDSTFTRSAAIVSSWC